MEAVSDLRIIGIDPKRPPRIQSIPCIDLVFELSHQAPREWCEDFNLLMSKPPYTVRIDPAEGLFIETWVRQPDEIPKALERMKVGVKACINAFIARMEAKAKANSVEPGVVRESEAQLGLNRVVEGLDFG
jgi:hypothetical protein